MTPRFICPHCHSPIDPLTMDSASTPSVLLRICPDCDEPIVFTTSAMRPTPAGATAQRCENATR